MQKNLAKHVELGIRETTAIIGIHHCKPTIPHVLQVKCETKASGWTVSEVKLTEPSAEAM